MITELLDLEKQQTDDIALDYFFNDLAKHNESLSTDIFVKQIAPRDEFMPHITPAFVRMACIGKQHVKKYRSQNANIDSVFIILVVVRLRNVETDILITLNLPYSPQRIQGLPLQVADNFVPDELLRSIDCLYFAPDQPKSPETQLIEAIFPEIKDLQKFLHFFRIQDWGLFL